jgi:hypothetical protein
MNRETEKIQIAAILETIKKDFQNGGPYAVWSAITTCNRYAFTYPEWVTKELGRIAKQFNSLENPQKSYPNQIAKVLNMSGYARRHDEAKRHHSKIWGLSWLAIKRGERRKDTVASLSKAFGLNERQVETLYDDAKKEHEMNS